MNKERIFKVIKGTQVSEKSTNILEFNQYVFKVAVDANKREIAAAVEALFEVDVVSVNTALVKGKRKAFGRRMGKRSNWKKAFVRIKEGQSIAELSGEGA